MVKPVFRRKSIGTKVSEEEYARLEARAGGRSLDEMGPDWGAKLAWFCGLGSRNRCDSGSIFLSLISYQSRSGGPVVMVVTSVLALRPAGPSHSKASSFSPTRKTGHVPSGRTSASTVPFGSYSLQSSGEFSSR